MLRLVHLVCKHPRLYFLSLSIVLYLAFARKSVLGVGSLLTYLLFAVASWLAIRFLYRLLLGSLAKHINLVPNEAKLRRMLLAKSTLLMLMLPISLLMGRGSGSFALQTLVFFLLLLVWAESISKRANKRLGIPKTRMRRSLVLSGVVGLLGGGFLILSWLSLVAM